MNQPESDSESNSPVDPRLKSFLRQSRAIISGERGLNENSRRKLRALADHVKLPDRLYEQALDELVEQAPESYTRYEKAFLTFLEKEFSQLKTGVLSPIAEQKAIRHASKKYQINETRAEQLIAVVSTSMDIARISVDESHAYVEAFVGERIGKSLAIDDELQESLYEHGEKWAIDHERIKAMIARKIQTNRDRRRSNIIQKIVWSLACLGTLAGFAAILIWLSDQYNSFQNQLTTDGEKRAIVDPTTEIEFPWLGEKAVSIEAILAKDRNLYRIVSSFDSGETKRKLSAVNELVELALEEADDSIRSTVSVLKLTYFNHPDPTIAQAISDELETYFLFDRQAAPMTVRTLKDNYRANKLAKLLLVESDRLEKSNPRKEPLRRLAESIVQTPLELEFDVAKMIHNSDQQVALNQWSLFAIQFDTNRISPSLLPPLFEISQSYLDHETSNQLLTGTLLQVFEAGFRDWRMLDSLILASLDSCNETNLIRWVKVGQGLQDDSFFKRIGVRILARCAPGRKFDKASEIKKALAQQLEAFQFDQLGPVLKRVRKLDERQQKSIDKLPSQLRTDQIAALARAVNIELEFCQSIRDSSQFKEDQFIEFDRLLEQPPVQLRESVVLSFDTKPDSPRQANGPTASDRRRLKSSLERLDDNSEESEGLRILAINQLARVSHRFDQISFPQAETLANYLLQPHGLREQLAIEKQIGLLSHWPRLATTLSDRILEANNERATTDLMRRFLRQPFEISNDASPDNLEELSLALLKHAGQAAEFSSHKGSDNASTDWRRLEIYLNDVFKERAFLLDENSMRTSSFASPNESAQQVLWILSNRSPEPTKKRLRRASQVLDNQTNAIVQLASIEQLVLVAIKSQITNEVDMIADQVELNPATATDAGNHLLQTEKALLGTVTAYRNFLIKSITSQGDLP